MKVFFTILTGFLLVIGTFIVHNRNSHSERLPASVEAKILWIGWGYVKSPTGKCYEVGSGKMSSGTFFSVSSVTDDSRCQ